MIYQISDDRSSLNIQSDTATAQIVWRLSDDDTYQPHAIKCWTGSDNWQLALAHELSHILIKVDKPELFNQTLDDLDFTYITGVPTIAIIRNEILTWRICKSILNPKYWQDDAWYWRLNSYWQSYYDTDLPEEFRIIEYQKGGTNGIPA